MSIDFNEARAIIEAAKKRGSIREAGSTLPPVSSASEPPAKPVILPEWLRTEIESPSSGDKTGAPVWRDS